MIRRRCVHCKTTISAESQRDLWREYTAHVVSEHGKPAQAGGHS